MEKYFSLLTKVILFKDIDAAELGTMLKCLNAEIKTVSKGEILLLSGEKPEHIGIVLAGQVHVSREDSDGNRSMLAAITPAGIFAEALCCAGVSESPVTVTAETDSVVMQLRFPRLLSTCSNSCAFHTKLIANMLKLIANKNLLLQDRMETVSLKSVRSKVVRYLKSFTHEPGVAFTIPFNREELADFLCVERSALSHELARMKKEGFIDYKKNKFTLYKSK